MAKSKEKTPAQVLSMMFGMGDELPKQKDTTRYEKIRKMRRDPTIALARWLCVAPILESEWSIETKEDAPAEAKDFIAESLLPHQNHLMRTGLYGCIDFGWQGYEKVWGMNRDGLFVVNKFKPLLHDITRVLVNVQDGSYEGLRQNPMTAEQIDLAPQETLLYNIDVEGTDWYGQAIMRVAEDPYDDWRDISRAANRYDRKVAGSHWVIHYPIGTSTVDGSVVDNLEVARRFVASLESSGCIAVPRQIADVIDSLNRQKQQEDAWHIELLSDTANTTTSFVERMKYLDALKVRAIGLPERSILEGQFGTKAEAGEHADFAISNMQQRHKLLVQMTNAYCVNDMLRMNFGPEAEDTVYIMPSPINDLAIGFLREIYTEIIKSPENFLLEFGSLDMEGLKKRLDIPILPEDEREDVDVVREILRPEVDPVKVNENEEEEEPAMSEV